MAKRRNRKTAKTKMQEPVITPGGWESPIVILFADIIGCSEISNHESPKKYNIILREFEKIFKATTKAYEEKFYQELPRTYFYPQVRGDEGCLMIFRTDPEPTKTDLWAADIDTAINIALDLKRRWLLSKYNKRRIKSGILTSDIAIGIHFGKAWINKITKNKYQPEGYAINLTKRIESSSREGAFTHIDISEAAYDLLYFLTDESTYTFTRHRLIKPKGFSQGINVFEIKHHFLPTDWTDDEVLASKWRVYDPTDNDIKHVVNAHRTNPTNLWLAEECIMMQMIQKYRILKTKGMEENKKSLRNAYRNAEKLARKLSTGPMHDVVSICILGFVLGEYGNYKEEQRLYYEAIKQDPLYAEAFWYYAYSMSREIFEKCEKEGPSGRKITDIIDEEDRTKIKKIFYNYSKASELKPWQAWMKYDHACELWRWGSRSEAVSMLERALRDNDRLCELISSEDYLNGIEEQPRIKKIIDRYYKDHPEP
jgi:class 3 adenylate cyclase